MVVTATQLQQGVFQFRPGDSVAWEHEAPSRTLPGDLAAGSPDQWLWCFECERAFQVRDVLPRDVEVVPHVECAYLDCRARADAFWKWESYRAFSGESAKPRAGVHFPLNGTVDAPIAA